jgi:hypothetical protein
MMRKLLWMKLNYSTVKWVLKCKYNPDAPVSKYPTLRFLITHCLAIKVTITLSYVTGDM